MKEISNNEFNELFDKHTDMFVDNVGIELSELLVFFATNVIGESCYNKRYSIVRFKKEFDTIKKYLYQDSFMLSNKNYVRRFIDDIRINEPTDVARQLLLLLNHIEYKLIESNLRPEKILYGLMLPLCELIEVQFNTEYKSDFYL